jgi:glycine/D-amino acid oxidase-like deaminating enzyme
MNAAYDSIVIGGGFFGCSLAISLARHHRKVLVLEQAPALMTRASYNNQARVHNGHHYPRSLLTALRSRVNFGRFVEDYAEAVVSNFSNYYAVARKFSHVTAGQFRIFFDRVGAPVVPAPSRVKRLFNDDLIEEVFAVKEYVFDSLKLAALVRRQMTEHEVDLQLDARVEKVAAAGNRRLDVSVSVKGDVISFRAGQVFNCTYSGINRVLQASQLPTIPLKHELTEMCLVDPPDELRQVGVTVMCGPFFSFMPFPPRGLHTLSHVRYTPHFSWRDDLSNATPSLTRPTNFSLMQKDAQRYLSMLKKLRYVDSLWEVKTVLPASEVNDSRPILFRKDHGLPNFTCVMGGKIDNVYDVVREVEMQHEPEALSQGIH